MNREIKFRCFNPKNEKMSPLIMTLDDIAVGDFLGDCLFEKRKTFNSKICMQFTVLVDKKGNPIYEGDICRILYTDWPSNTDPNISLEDYMISISHVGEVVYQAPEFGILLPDDRYGDKVLGSFNYGPHGRLEVIGNIYQNPELLK